MFLICLSCCTVVKPGSGFQIGGVPFCVPVSRPVPRGDAADQRAARASGL